MAVCGAPADCEDCVQVVRSTKKVQVPCTRNTYKQYTVQVPRTVNERVPRQVTYTDYETRTKQVPYTVNRTETRQRTSTQSYQVPVTKEKTRMVSVTKQVPKTVMVPRTTYVNVTTQVPQSYKTTEYETRTRQVQIPYTVNVPETRYRTVSEKHPVQRTKTEYSNVTKTVFDTQTRTRCVPETKMVTKEIPVYHVRARPAPPCASGDCGTQIPTMSQAHLNEFDAMDKNQDGQITRDEMQGTVSHGGQFNSADADGDGALDLHEFNAARKQGMLGQGY